MGRSVQYKPNCPSKPNNDSFFFLPSRRLAAKTEQASSSTAAAGPSLGIGGRATDSPEEEGVGVGVVVPDG